MDICERVLIAEVMYLLATAIYDEIGDSLPGDFAGDHQFSFQLGEMSACAACGKSVITGRDAEAVDLIKLATDIQVGIDVQAALLEVSGEPSLFVDEVEALANGVVSKREKFGSITARAQVFSTFAGFFHTLAKR